MCMSVSIEDFKVKINEVSGNLYLSHFHLKIHEKMTEQKNLRLNEEEYPPFFEWSRMANYEAGILRLTKAYDDDNESLGLLKVINTIQSNYRFWCNSNPDLPRTLDVKELEQDRSFVTTNQLVKGLNTLRNKVISHTDNRLHPKELNFVLDDVYSAFYSGQNQILGKDVPSFNQYYELTTKGVEICNRYKKKIGMPPIELGELGLEEIE